MTVLVQIATGAGRPDLRPDSWIPWVNAETLTKEDLSTMALRKFIRERGGILPGEGLIIQVFVHSPGMAKHPNGNPAEVWGTVYHCGQSAEYRPVVAR